MPGGINLPPGTVAGFGGIAYAGLQTGDLSGLSSLIPTFGPYRPTVWSKPALTMVTVPAAYGNDVDYGVSADDNDNGQYVGSEQESAAATQAFQPMPAASSSAKYYVFDAVMSLQHSQSVTLTKNPIQTGSSVADHAYLTPARLTLAIGMSDAQDAYAKGMWVGASTKSTSAFVTMTNLRDQRIPLTVTTRLKTYSNMMILDVRASESVKTLHGLSAVIEFEQIFVADVASVANGTSARTQTTDSSNQGTVPATQVPAGVSAQNELPSSYTNVPDASTLQSSVGTVQGAGTWSSNNTGGLAGLAP